MVSLSRTRILITSLIKRDRTEITPKDYFKKFTRLIILQFCVGVALSALIILWLGVTFASLFIGVFLVIVPLVIALRFRTKTRRVLVKGDSLILKNYQKRSLVTSLRSIKTVRTYCLPGIHITRLVYNLDGRDKKVMIINSSWAVVNTPEKLIRKAMHLSKEEKRKRQTVSRVL